ncbi:MAG: hypothetical protein R6U15_06540 [Candidatus Izemoplasmatales bacterium]
MKMDTDKLDMIRKYGTLKSIFSDVTNDEYTEKYRYKGKLYTVTVSVIDEV